MELLRQTLDIQEKQAFRDISPRFDLNRLIPQLTPHKDAVYYMVDCRNSAILYLKGNVRKLCSREAGEFRHLSDIFSLIHEDHMESVIEMKGLALRWAVDMNRQLIPLHHKISMEVNINGNGRISSVRWDTLIAHTDSAGNLTHTIGIFYPLNGKLKGGIRVIKGPYSDFIIYPEAVEFQPVFGRKEMLILNHLAMGYSNREIAEKISLSHRTVETHRKNMIRKVEARNTPHLIYLATQMGLL
jgi:DNA-binding CsgD family transcriptional regulator